MVWGSGSVGSYEAVVRRLGTKTTKKEIGSKRVKRNKKPRRDDDRIVNATDDTRVNEDENRKTKNKEETNGVPENEHPSQSRTKPEGRRTKWSAEEARVDKKKLHVRATADSASCAGSEPCRRARRRCSGLSDSSCLGQAASDRVCMKYIVSVLKTTGQEQRRREDDNDEEIDVGA